MTLHRGSVFYALCDERWREVAPCFAFVLPPISSDPTGRAALLADVRDVFTAARAAGWQVDGSGDDETWLCPEHRTKPAVGVVAMPLFDMPGGSS